MQLRLQPYQFCCSFLKYRKYGTVQIYKNLVRVQILKLKNKYFNRMFQHLSFNNVDMPYTRTAI
jgi:hypothetical protein